MTKAPRAHGASPGACRRRFFALGAEYFPEAKRETIPPLAFLGGHPRSGTTLLEQVLDAHPGVAALDEPSAFLDVLQPEFHRSEELSTARLNTLRRLYVQRLLRRRAPRGRATPARQESLAHRAIAALAQGLPRIAGAHRLARPAGRGAELLLPEHPPERCERELPELRAAGPALRRPDGHLAGRPGMGRLHLARGPATKTPWPTSKKKDTE